MRGPDQRQTSLFTFVTTEERIPASHPLRVVRGAVGSVMAELSGRFDKIYARGGRASIPPEQLLRALLIWALYGVPSERRLLEELEYNLLFRWFVGIGLEDPVWAHTTFRQNRRRLINAGLAADFLARCLSRLPGRLIYNGHFSMNWSLVEEWSGQQSLDELDEEEDDDDRRGRAQTEYD
ncbi:MAG: transposase [Planctomycetes bacterium]|nr:transposase [Planctomycetota bacterium]